MKYIKCIDLDIKLDYPIKYAVLELKEQGRYLTNNKKYTSGYIISKCKIV